MEQSTITEGPLLIAHMADLHLRDTQYAAARRGMDFFEAAKAAAELAVEHADMAVMVGDIFDRSRPSPKVISQLMQINRIFVKAGKTCLAVTGNHDWSSPTWLSTLFPSDVEGPGIVPLDNRQITVGGFTFAGVNPYTAGSFRANMADVTRQARDADVVIYHGLVSGVVPFYAGVSDPLRVDEFPISRNNKAWLLGDIHIQGYVNPARPGGGSCLVGYPGSTEVASASEPLEKSLPIVRLTKGGATVDRCVDIPTRPYIRAEVTTPEALDELMARVQRVADQHPVVSVKFSRDLPHTISRLHSMLDAQRAVVRCSPLPHDKRAERRETDNGTEDLGLEHFVSARFKDREDLESVALSLLARGVADASSVVTDLIESRLVSDAVREEF